MLPRPRILAIDDELTHLEAIASALNERGIACLKRHFNGAIQLEERLSHVRVLFIDLHLAQPGLGDVKSHYSTIGSILYDCISPDNGPFILIVWTSYPAQVTGLAEFLSERLQDQPAAIPVMVDSLSKEEHLADGKIVDVAVFMQAIDACLGKQPAVEALVNWEERATSAASETIAAVMSLVSRQNHAALDGELSRVLNALATEAAGRANVGKRRFSAVNEALLPILYDRVSQLRHVPEAKCWEKAIPKPGSTSDLDLKQAGRLNSLLHVDFDLKHARKTERGIVLSRDDGTWTDEAFKSWFGVDKTFFIEKQLRLTIAGADRVRLVLVQVQATCDNAQGMPGPPPYLLGVECPETVVLELEPGPSLWLGPALEIDGEQRRVLISYRFAVGLPKGAVAEFSMLYRFREALANDLVTRWHSYGARPGIISFHAETKPPEPRGDSEAPFSHIKY